MRTRLSVSVLGGAAAVVACSDAPTGEADAGPGDAGALDAAPGDGDAVESVVLVEDGGWCWYQDERAVFAGDRLAVATLSHEGDVQVSSYDLPSGRRQHAVLSRRLERDDHDVASLLLREDGRLLATYSRHTREPILYSRLSSGTDGDVSSWEPERRLSLPSNVCYSNPFQLADEGGRIWMFFRGLQYNPTVVASDDGGTTWSAAGQLIDSFEIQDGQRRNHRPYVKYASDGRGTIHMVYTDGHPREFNGTPGAPRRNSIYHLYYRDGKIHRSDGEVVAEMRPGAGARLAPSAGTLIHDGDSAEGGEAWTWDLALDAQGNPVAVYATFPDPTETGELVDHRYRYARWDGEVWRHQFVAHAGRGLYPGERFYSGGIAVDPDDTSVVYFSSNVDPVDGGPNRSGRYEIHRGRAGEGEEGWTFEAVTEGSIVDNLRPIVPPRHPTPTAVLWVEGVYNSFTDYHTRVVGLFGSAHATARRNAPDEPLPAVGRFDIDLPGSPTAEGFASAPVMGDRLSGSAGPIGLSATQVTGARDRVRGGDLYRDLALNDRGGVATGDKLRVRLTGLEPDQPAYVRLHQYDPEQNPLESVLWFAGGAGGLEADRNPALLAGHRLVNSSGRAAGALGLALDADGAGVIELLARGADGPSILNGVEVAPRPGCQVVGRFDIEAPGGETAPGATSLSFDDDASDAGSASAGGLTLTVKTDRLGALRDRGGGTQPLLRDFVFADDELTAELGGLTADALYEITVHSADLAENAQAASFWWLEEEGSQPIVIRASQVNPRIASPAASFTFYHRAKRTALRLRAQDTPPGGVVLLNGLDVCLVEE